jgi:hypothetical protein
MTNEKRRTLGDQVNHRCKVWALCLMTRPHQLHEMSLVVVTLVNFLHVVYRPQKNTHIGFSLPLSANKWYIYRICVAPGGLATAEPAERLPAERGESESDYHEIVSFILQVRWVMTRLTIGVADESTFPLALLEWVTVGLSWSYLRLHREFL